MARILIIDDEEVVRYGLRDTLEEYGHTVLEAGDGVEGLEVLEREPVDLVLVDLIMPRMEGVETTIQVKRRYPETRLLAISGGGRTRNFSYLEMTKEFGADGTLSKPFTDLELMAAVDKVMEAGA